MKMILGYIFLLILSRVFANNAANNIKLNFGKNIDASVLKTGKALTNSLITKLIETSFVSCLNECTRRPRCTSINYRRQFLLCELNQDVTDDIAVYETETSIFMLISPWISRLDNACSKGSSIGDDLKMECIFDEFGSLEKRISDCGAPPGKWKAMYNVSNGIGLFSRATYSCESGYGGNGPSTISCMENGAWSDQGFQCIKVCGQGYEPAGYFCSECHAGTYSPSTGISDCLYCPSDQYHDLSGQESCMNCTINDNPCGNVYTIPDTNVIVEPSDDRTECRAIYFCRTSSGISIESQNVYVICDRDGSSGSYTFHWTRPSLHCISGVSSESISSWSSSYDDCEHLQLTQTSYEGQIVEINSRTGGTFYCDTSYDGDYWTVLQQRSSERGTDAFDRTWSEFKNGFGSINNDFWIGNDNLHRLTSIGSYEVLILLWVGDGNYTRQETARYRYFEVKNEHENYKLEIDQFDDGKSDADDFMTERDGWSFSTKDNEETALPCSQEQDSGWWHKTYKILVIKFCTTRGNVNALKWKNFYDKTRVLIKPT